jgi:glutathione S-transferase
MSKLKIYGVPRSRAFRTLWLAKELGLDYEHVPVNFTGDNRKPEYLAINPMGQVPAIDDGGFVLTESMAINLYLAKKHGKLYPKSPQDEAKAWQWSFWVMTAVEKPSLQVLFHTVFFPEDKRDPAQAEEGRKQLARPLAVLEQALAGKPYLLGPEFTICDLNVAAVLSTARSPKLGIELGPNVRGWLERCLDRPAAKETSALR